MGRRYRSERDRREHRNSSRANMGMDWEEILRTRNRGYWNRRQAYVIKRGPPIRVVSDLGEGFLKGKFEGKGPPDYGGTLAGGRSVEFEAKSTKQNTAWPLAQIKDHQAACLSAVTAMGGIAFVALKTPRGFFVLPWPALSELFYRWQFARDRGWVTPGQGSVRLLQMERIGKRMSRPGDWLPPLLELISEGAFEAPGREDGQQDAAHGDVDVDAGG